MERIIKERERKKNQNILTAKRHQQLYCFVCRQHCHIQHNKTKWMIEIIEEEREQKIIWKVNYPMSNELDTFVVVVVVAIVFCCDLQ